MYFSGVSDLVARRGHGGQFLNFLADLFSTVFERRYRKPSSRGSVTRPLEELAIELIGSSDETSGPVLAQDILSGFEEIEDAGKLAFFRHIATEMHIDPVAGIHRGNGAIEYAVRAAADISDIGIARADGTMVNCRYDLNKVEQNRKDFASTQKITATATMVSLANASSALRVGER